MKCPNNARDVTNDEAYADDGSDGIEQELHIHEADALQILQLFHAGCTTICTRKQENNMNIDQKHHTHQDFEYDEYGDAPSVCANVFSANLTALA